MLEYEEVILFSTISSVCTPFRKYSHSDTVRYFKKMFHEAHTEVDIKETAMFYMDPYK